MDKTFTLRIDSKTLDLLKEATSSRNCGRNEGGVSKLLRELIDYYIYCGMFECATKSSRCDCFYCWKAGRDFA